MKYRLSSLILCGGKGSRLKNIGKKTPKCLIKINRKYFIKYILSGLSNEFIDKIIISGFHKFDILKKTLNKLRIKNLFVYNDGDISILSRIKKTLDKENENLLVCYGDEYANVNLKKLIESHVKSKKLLTITTIKLKSNFGLLKKVNKKIKFIEKPYIGNCNIGYMIFDKKNIQFIKNQKSLPNYINKLGSLNEVNIFFHDKSHITINTLEDIFLAKTKFKTIN